MGNHDGGQAHTTTAMHNNPLTGGYPALIHDCSKRRCKPAAQTGRRLKIHLIRQANQINVRIMNGHELRKRAPMRKARLKLVIADLLVA